MPRRRKRWNIVSLLALVALAFFLVPVLRVSNERPPIVRAEQAARRIALSLRLYSDDHDGNLPPSLHALSPDYLSDESRINDFQLMTPSQNIAKLPPQAIILQSITPIRGLIVLVHSDYSTETRNQ